MGQLNSPNGFRVGFVLAEKYTVLPFNGVRLERFIKTNIYATFKAPPKELEIWWWDDENFLSLKGRGTYYEYVYENLYNKIQCPHVRPNLKFIWTNYFSFRDSSAAST